MLLRASGEKESAAYDLTAITDRSRNSGVPNGELLTALAEQTAGAACQALKGTLAKAIETMGEQQAVDALVVASAFNGITRVADATGIPLDENTAETTVEMRGAVGLDAYQYAAKSARYD
jgi:hypothetical protein